MMYWWKYQRIMYKLHKAKRQELIVKKLCEGMDIDFEDLNLRNINDKLKKIDELWLSKNWMN